MTNTTPSKTLRDSLESSGSSVAAAIAVERASRRYGDLEALEPTSFAVGRGEATALLGPSGSGKTTLMLLMSGQLRPTSGRVLINGADLAGMQPGRDLARMVGMIPQQFDLVANLSALQNVLAGRLGEWSLVESLVSLLYPRDRAVAMAALDRVGIADRARERAGRLSGGEQQRVAIARLMLQDPEVVLADEPIASLDPARADAVLALLAGVARETGKTLVASIHSEELAHRYFSRIVGLRNGAVLFHLDSDQVTSRMLGELYDPRGLRGEA